MQFSDVGSGFPVVLLHGYCETRSVWENVVSELSSHFRFITPDLPGFGKTPIIDPLTIELVASEVMQLTVQLSIDKCIVIGHSLGGYITLALEDQHPELIRGYGLFHSTAFEDSPEKKKGREQVAKIVNSKGPSVFLNNFYQNLFFQPPAGVIEQLQEEGSTITAKSIASYALAMKDRPDRSHLLRSEKPKLIIAGKEDGAVPYESSMNLFEMAENCDCITLDQSGHMGMFEEPESAVLAVNNFLKRAIEA